LFSRVVSDSESIFEKSSVSENESEIDFVNNNVHLLDEQSALVNLSGDVSVIATAINIQPSLFSDTVVYEVPAVLSQIPFDASTIVFSSNVEGESLSVPATSDSKGKGKALKSDFKSMYADFHIAGNSL
jgi:hypothetical protein